MCTAAAARKGTSFSFIPSCKKRLHLFTIAAFHLARPYLVVDSCVLKPGHLSKFCKNLHNTKALRSPPGHCGIYPGIRSDIQRVVISWSAHRPLISGTATVRIRTDRVPCVASCNIRLHHPTASLKITIIYLFARQTGNTKRSTEAHLVCFCVSSAGSLQAILSNTALNHSTVHRTLPLCILSSRSHMHSHKLSPTSL